MRENGEVRVGCTIMEGVPHMKPLVAWERMPDCPGKVAIIKQVNLLNAQSVQITHFDVFMGEVAKQVAKHEAKKVLPPMFWHEAIFADKPCHLFMDCDKDLACVDGVWETIDRDAFIQNVHEQVVQVVARCPSIITTAPTYPLFLDATREDKFSLHLLWNTSAKIPAELRALIQDIEAPFGVTIDRGPCSSTTTTPKSLRMPWCGKRSAKDFREAVSVLRPAAPWDAFTPESFCKHLVSIYADKSEKWAHALSPVPTELYTHPNGSGKKRLASVREGYMEAGEDFTSRIFDWFQMYNPTFTPAPEVCPNGGYRSRAQVYCPLAGRWHKSNGGMLFVDAFGYGRVICFDPYCCVPWSLPYSDAYLRATEEPVQIDWDIMALIRK